MSPSTGSKRWLSRAKRQARTSAHQHGYALRAPARNLSTGFGEEAASAIGKVAAYTMGTAERMAALFDVVSYVLDAAIPGDIVECGVWRGGSMMLVANELRRRGVTDRDLWLYDTFTGMTPPEAVDFTVDGTDGRRWFDAEQLRPEPGSSGVTGVPLEEVAANMGRTGYPAERIHYVVGPVEQTLLAERPEQIALLRLDTDFYASTKAEMDHLYPLLTKGGFLLLDDYGYWQGARRAVDEYFADRAPFLHRIDQSARLMVKP